MQGPMTTDGDTSVLVSAHGTRRDSARCKKGDRFLMFGVSPSSNQRTFLLGSLPADEYENSSWQISLESPVPENGVAVGACGASMRAARAGKRLLRSAEYRMQYRHSGAPALTFCSRSTAGQREVLICAACWRLRKPHEGRPAKAIPRPSGQARASVGLGAASQH